MRTGFWRPTQRRGEGVQPGTSCGLRETGEGGITHVHPLTGYGTWIWLGGERYERGRDETEQERRETMINEPETGTH
jgi:hypothetical protein